MLDKLRDQAKKLMDKNPEKYSIIMDIISNDSCFFEMSIEESYSILRDLMVKEEDIKKVYLNLIKKENYDKE